MTLYEIKEDILKAINDIEIDEETGEIVSMGALDELQEQFSDKAENIALYIKNTNAEAEAIKTEEKRLSERRKALENKAERLKQYLSNAMNETGMDKISTSKVALSFRKTNVVEVDDGFIEWAEKNADFLLDYKPPTASKTAIKNAIKNGSAVEYAHLTERKNLIIR